MYFESPQAAAASLWLRWQLRCSSRCSGSSGCRARRSQKNRGPSTSSPLKVLTSQIQHTFSLSPLGLGLPPTQVSRCGELWRVMWRVMEVREFECGHTKRCWLFSGQKVLGQNLEREQSVGERQTHSWPLNPHSYIQLYRCRHHNAHTTTDKATRTLRLFLSKSAWQSWTKAWLNAPPLFRLIFFFFFFLSLPSLRPAPYSITAAVKPVGLLTHHCGHTQLWSGFFAPGTN